MHIDPELLHIVVGFITGGGLLKAIDTAIKVRRAIKAGFPLREQRIRIDIVKQRDLAIRYGHRLRELLLTRGVTPADIPDWPKGLEEHL